MDAKASCCVLRSLAWIKYTFRHWEDLRTQLFAFLREGNEHEAYQLMRTVFAVPRTSSVATQVDVQEPTKRESMRIMNGILTLIICGFAHRTHSVT